VTLVRIPRRAHRSEGATLHAVQLGRSLCAKVETDGVVPESAAARCVAGAARGAEAARRPFSTETYEVYTDGEGCPVEGRRPAGLAELGPVSARTAAGAWLARAAWLEAASIHAFIRLARELEQHAAPPALVRWALLAAGEEVEHTRAMSRLAARYGGRAPIPEVAPPVARSLEALAIENAAEGCVRETWGAAIAEWQSRTARDPEVRAVFATIARDEARHAALAWAIDRWARTQLDEDACARVDAAQQAAARELASSADLVSPALGLPDETEVRGLYARAVDSLWNGGRTCHA
jgi:hypothetical protein